MCRYANHISRGLDSFWKEVDQTENTPINFRFFRYIVGVGAKVASALLRFPGLSLPNNIPNGFNSEYCSAVSFLYYRTWNKALLVDALL